MRVALSTFLIASLLKSGGRKEGRRGGGGCGGGAAVLPALLSRVCATFGQVENAKRHAESEEEEEERRKSLVREGQV